MFDTKRGVLNWKASLTLYSSYLLAPERVSLDLHLLVVVAKREKPFVDSVQGVLSPG